MNDSKSGILLVVSFIDRVNWSTQHDRCTEKKTSDLLKNTDKSVLLKVESSTPHNEQESSSQTWVIGDGYDVNPNLIDCHHKGAKIP